MAQATFTSTLTIGELEASFPLQCKALHILFRENKPIERTESRHRLWSLHQSLSRQYKDPRQLALHHDSCTIARATLMGIGARPGQDQPTACRRA